MRKVGHVEKFLSRHNLHPLDGHFLGDIAADGAVEGNRADGLSRLLDLFDLCLRHVPKTEPLPGCLQGGRGIFFQHLFQDGCRLRRFCLGAVIMAFLRSWNRLLSYPFFCIDEFLLCGQKFRAINLRQRLSFFHISACIINVKLLNPSFDFCIDRGLVPLVYFNSSHRPNGLLNGFDDCLDGLDADTLLQFRRDLNLRGLLYGLFLLFLRWRLCLRRCRFGLLCSLWHRVPRVTLGMECHGNQRKDNDGYYCDKLHFFSPFVCESRPSVIAWSRATAFSLSVNCVQYWVSYSSRVFSLERTTIASVLPVAYPERANSTSWVFFGIRPLL